ncbi:RNA polymerase sigma-70 factor, ECF subfamily [Lampropedia hyalina DSM 16112]|uniref:RNA polymerase sigma-70 factor, ECF subfamily n=2 Tax=Lampropedia TaxID=198705 RepID=A0A1M5BE47_9BURK|nr:RNA polymerase sigma-70 factor, ECF subfamily [Lampropedia hyalina DSM 16112]
MTMQGSSPSEQVAMLYQQNHSWLKTWLQQRVQNPDIAADLMQDTFVRLLGKHLPPGELRQPRAYLTTIAKGLLHDHWRKMAVEQAWLDTLAALPPASLPSEEERLIVWQTLQELDRLLGELSPTVRQVFLLSQLEGLAYADIAQELQLSERTIKRHMARAFEVCLTLMMQDALGH